MGIASALVATLALVAPPVYAAPEVDPDAEARRLHQEGQARYDTADYAGAIESWTRAYAALPNRAKSAAMRPVILYNIASAREKAYDVYGDVAQLRQARELLVKFEESIDEIFTDSEQAEHERARVRERIAHVDARIEQHERGASPPGDDAEPVSDSLPPPVVTAPPPQMHPVADEPAKGGPDARVITGGVLLGLGAAAAGVGFAGLGIGVKANDLDGLADDDLDGRERQFDRGRAGNAMAIAGVVAAPVLLGVGIALVVLAKTRPRAARGQSWIAPGMRAAATVGLRF